jgi:hypothetical protein
MSTETQPNLGRVARSVSDPTSCASGEAGMAGQVCLWLQAGLTCPGHHKAQLSLKVETQPWEPGECGLDV